MSLAQSIHEEGLRIPPVKLVKAGETDREILRLILANVRKLKQISPDHILVKAVQAVCDLAQQSDEVKEQLPLDL